MPHFLQFENKFAHSQYGLVEIEFDKQVVVVHFEEAVGFHAFAETVVHKVFASHNQFNFYVVVGYYFAQVFGTFYNVVLLVLESVSLEMRG